MKNIGRESKAGGGGRKNENDLEETNEKIKGIGNQENWLC